MSNTTNSTVRTVHAPASYGAAEAFLQRLADAADVRAEVRRKIAQKAAEADLKASLRA